MTWWAPTLTRVAIKVWLAWLLLCIVGAASPAICPCLVLLPECAAGIHANESMCWRNECCNYSVV